MANLLVLVLDDLEQFPAIVSAWKDAGVPGITVFDSAGARKLENFQNRDDLPLMPSLRSLFAAGVAENRTLFSVIADDVVLHRAIAATEAIVGDFMKPDTGILFVVPVTETRGVRKK